MNPHFRRHTLNYRQKLCRTPGSFTSRPANSTWTSSRCTTGLRGCSVLNCKGGPAPQGRALPQFLALSPKITISPSQCRYVVGTSNSSTRDRRCQQLSRRMRVQILTRATEEGVVFLVTFPDAKAHGCGLTVSSVSQSTLSDVTSQSLPPSNRAIAANMFGFKRIAFWGIAFFVA